MTEYSLPMPGTTIGDAGPYAVGGAAAPGWWDRWGIESRAGGRLTQVALADIGVFYCVDDQLECTVAADTTSIDVDEGAAQVDGIFYWNDTDPVNVPIPAAGAGDDRIDLVVVRKNFQATTDYTPGGGAPTCLRRETRITVIRGVEAVGPAAPTVTQDVTRATYWDIPLCTVQVDDAGALTELTDLREYVDVETKEILVQFVGGDAGGGLALDDPKGWLLGSAVTTDLFAFWEVPVDFISALTATPLTILDDTTGNMVVETDFLYGTCGQPMSTHNNSESDTVTIFNIRYFDCLDDVTTVITPANPGDFLRMRFRRTGGAGGDTAGEAYGMGYIMSYLGWRR